MFNFTTQPDSGTVDESPAHWGHHDPDLPPGTRQSDCDGGEEEIFNPQAAFDALDPKQLAKLADGFFDLFSAEIIDALEGTTDTTRGERRPAGHATHCLHSLKSSWREYRDRELEEWRRSGKI